METYTQEDRPIAIETPLGTDALLLISFEGVEELSRLFRFELELESGELDYINPRDIVGKNVTFLVRDRDEDPHYFNGFVRRFAYRGQDDRLSLYTAEVVPWLWFLTRVSNCRIFQHKTVPDIVKEIFEGHGFKDFEFKLGSDYREREYCVQYRETDFNFVSRLLEDEGIFYFFRHANGKHTLVLADEASHYEDCPDKEDGEIDMSSTLRDHGQYDQIIEWEHAYEYRSGKVAMRDFNFERPESPVPAEKPTLVELDNIGEFELYDYPGSFEDDSEGDALAKVRMEEEETHFDVFAGTSICRGFHPGLKFKIVKHHCREEEGKSYVLTSVRHKVSVGSTFETQTNGKVGETTQEYQNKFRCIPDTATFRPERTTPHAVVHGNQTAFVVGPDGEEIYTDKYGRVKVQFHWDRYGEADENSSCWIRVAQVWASKKWGAMFIPRIGDEVVVAFEHGDPDRPIIVGRVYNGENEPPYELPDNKTISLIKTRSSKDAEDDDFNEIRFEDKKGEEQIYIHAQKNLDVRVENDRFETIEHDRHLVVDNDKHEHVKNDRHETVDRHHHERIKEDRHLHVEGKEAKKVDGSLSLVVEGDVGVEYKSDHSLVVSDDCYIKASNIVIEGTSNITLKVGGSSIAIESGGITITTSGKAEVSGSGGLALESSGISELKGSLVKIN